MMTYVLTGSFQLLGKNRQKGDKRLPFHVSCVTILQDFKILSSMGFPWKVRRLHVKRL